MAFGSFSRTRRPAENREECFADLVIREETRVSEEAVPQLIRVQYPGRLQVIWVHPEQVS